MTILRGRRVESSGHRARRGLVVANILGAMLSLLEELVNIDGGSYDKAGVDAVGARIRAFLDSTAVNAF